MFNQPSEVIHIEPCGAILLVDNDEYLIKINRISLELRRYTVYTAATFAEAQLRLEDTVPDIIIMEVYLPDGDGFAFCREARSKTDSHLFFLTSWARPQDIDDGHKAGCDAYITKPFMTERLMQQVEAAMRRRRWSMTSTASTTNMGVCGDVES